MQPDADQAVRLVDLGVDGAVAVRVLVVLHGAAAGSADAEEVRLVLVAGADVVLGCLLGGRGGGRDECFVDVVADDDV